jgi:hypothetical protein
MWSGTDAGVSEDVADRSRADVMTRADQFALDAPVSPSGIFSQANDQFAEFGVDRRAA